MKHKIMPENKEARQVGCPPCIEIQLDGKCWYIVCSFVKIAFISLVSPNSLAEEELFSEQMTPCSWWANEQEKDNIA